MQVSILLESFPVKQMKALAFSTGSFIYSAVVSDLEELRGLQQLISPKISEWVKAWLCINRD